MSEIIEILNRNNINGFDKIGGTDKATDHSYHTFYENEFKRFKDKKGTLLELGSFNGGSALLWHEYLNNFNIVMTDVIDQVPSKIKEKLTRSEFIITDSFNKETVKILKDKYKGFDIIIEDGPHTLETQLFALKEYSKLLNKGGVLIIEDIQSENDLNELLSVKLRGKSIELVDLRHIKNRYDDLMIVVRK